MPPVMKIPDAEAAVDRKWEKLETIPAWQLHKEQKRCYPQNTDKQRTVHFAALMDICHLKNAELEPKFQRHNGRVLLRGDKVKDDSCSCAVFTEQGVIARQTDCAGKAADAVSAKNSGKIGGCFQIAQIFLSQNVQIIGYVFHDTSGPNPGQTLKTLLFLLNEIFMVTHLLDCCGETF